MNIQLKTRIDLDKERLNSRITSTKRGATFQTSTVDIQAENIPFIYTIVFLSPIFPGMARLAIPPFIFVGLSVMPGVAQRLELINSKTAINEGKRCYDSGSYVLSKKEFRKIDPRDTNYVYSLSEVARVYFDDYRT